MMSRCFCAPFVLMLLSVVAEPGLAQAGADALPRRAALGVPLAVERGNVIVMAVPEGSAAAEAGMLAGDTLAELDGVPVASTAQVQFIIGSHREGDSLPMDVVRGNESRHLVA